MRRFAFLAIVATLSGASVRAAPALSTSASATDPSDATRFTCSDTVFLHIAWNPVLPQAHRIQAAWRNTTTGLEHVSELTTTPNTPASWLWLRYEPPAGAGFGKLIAPDSGFDGFAGPWVVNITLDGQPLGEKRFEVQC